MFQRVANWLRRSSSAPSEAQGHLTFGSTSVGRTITRTGVLLKKQLWIWPIIAVVLLAVIGYGLRVAIEETMRDNLRSQLLSTVTLERSMLRTWLKVQESGTESLANDQQVRNLTAKLLQITEPEIEGEGDNDLPSAQLKLSSEVVGLSTELGHELGPGMSSRGFTGFFIADKQGRILASSNRELIGRAVPHQFEGIIGRSFAGHPTVSPPFPSLISLKDEFGRVRTGVPTMYSCAPIRDANFQVVAVLGLRIPPEHEFTGMLQIGRIGHSGETYAIDKEGTFISNSRFDNDLILLGLLPDTENSTSLLQLSARNPGGNMLTGFRPGVRRAELPLTKSAEAATSGEKGFDLDGYPDYRGVPVVGAWEWLPEYDIGLITELDHAEAYRPLTILRWVFFSLFGLLVLSSVAIFAFTVMVARLNREAQKAAIEAKHLGQYRLDERIGAGAMGVVYRGHHAMLRRPTAIKMLDVARVNEASIERFEREVQVTCKLNNPNTVAIYDYGRTPEGVFYYAMEYLDGIDLQALVEEYGPQSEGRVIHILKQICGSLFEAHSLGLVHRDIKPANVMLNRRGGEPDVVKVLDFGLVRAVDEAKRQQQSGGMSGTPLYMSPEAIQTPDLVDARSDLYAVGAIGYFLLTGKPVFDAASLVELCQHHVDTLPETPSSKLGREISPELESALMSCLEKSRAKRPQTARDLAALLERAPTARRWALEEAEAWWGRHERARATGSAATSSTTGSNAGNGSTSRSTNAGTPSNRTSTAGLEQTIAASERRPPGS